MGVLCPREACPLSWQRRDGAIQAWVMTPDRMEYFRRALPIESKSRSNRVFDAAPARLDDILMPFPIRGIP